MRNLILLIFVFSSLISVAQQTPQTSFFTQSRANWNAAYTGMNEQISVNTFLRQQWLGFGLDAPRTLSLDFQYPFVDLNMAAGAAIHYDQTGPVSKRGINLNYAYQVKDLGLNEGQLSFGIMAGGHQYVFNPSDQVVTNDVDQFLESGTQTAFYPSVGGGIFLFE
jgi:type IX secretion system PorP/SprF family membrane protein